MIVGIDLGTTNSLVAYYSEEGPKIIPNRLGKNLTPSVVSVDEEGNVYVGETALERMSLYPDSVALAFKRSMGSGREYTLSGKRYKPEELSYLKVQLRDQEENRLALLKAERMYEESLGERRNMLEYGIRRFEEALRKGERVEVDEARKGLYKIMEDD